MGLEGWARVALRGETLARGMRRWKGGDWRGGVGGAWGRVPRWEEGVVVRRGLEWWVREALGGGAPAGGKGSREVKSKGRVRVVFRRGRPPGGRDGEETGLEGVARGRAEGVGREKEPPGGGSQPCIVYSSFFRSSSGVSGWR